VVSNELLLARMKSRQFMDRAPCAGVYVDLIPYIPASLDLLQRHDLIVMGVPVHDEFRPAFGERLLV
jgi:hypothetical protein